MLVAYEGSSSGLPLSGLAPGESDPMDWAYEGTKVPARLVRSYSPVVDPPFGNISSYPNFNTSDAIDTALAA